MASGDVSARLFHAYLGDPELTDGQLPTVE